MKQKSQQIPQEWLTPKTKHFMGVKDDASEGLSDFSNNMNDYFSGILNGKMEISRIEPDGANGVIKILERSKQYPPYDKICAPILDSLKQAVDKLNDVQSLIQKSADESNITLG